MRLEVVPVALARQVEKLADDLADARGSRYTLSRHIKAGPAGLYVRVGPRFGPDRIARQAFVIADITIADEERGKGLGLAVLTEFECCARRLGLGMLYAESVVNERLHGFLERFGFVAVDPLRLNFAKVLEAP